MAKRVQLRRGTSAQNNAFTGAVGEVTVDTDLDTLRVHDGATAGGFSLLRNGNDGTIRTLNVTQYAGGAGLITGDKNRVINGSMQIVNQATFVASNNTNGYGGPEMFVAVNSNAGGQFTQAQAILNLGGVSLPTIRQTVNTANTNIDASNNWSGIQQRLEGFNVFDLIGKPIALSFVFNTNVTGTYSVGVRDSASTQSYVTTINATANTPLQVIIPVSAIPLAASIPNSNATGISVLVGALNTGTLQTATLNQWQSGSFISATGATNWGLAAGNYIELTNLHLEEGTIATPFVRRSYGQELMLTQRYFATVSNNVAFSGNVTNGNNYFATYTLPVTMRATPSLTGTNLNALSFPATTGTLGTQLGGRLVTETRNANASASGVFGSSITASARL